MDGIFINNIFKIIRIKLTINKLFEEYHNIKLFYKIIFKT